MASLNPDFWPGGRSVCEGSPVTIMREPSPRRVKNIFICIDVAFCASSSSTQALLKVRPRMNARGSHLDHAGLHAAFEHAGIHEISERIIDRPQIRIDLVAHIARQEAKPLARFQRRPRQDDPLDGSLFQQKNREADGQPGLAGASRAFREHKLVTFHGAQIEVLRRVARPHAPAPAGADLLENSASRLVFLRKQAALHRAFLDRAIDIAKTNRLAERDPRIEIFEDEPRLFAGFRACP